MSDCTITTKSDQERVSIGVGKASSNHYFNSSSNALNFCTNIWSIAIHLCPYTSSPTRYISTSPGSQCWECGASVVYNITRWTTSSEIILIIGLLWHHCNTYWLFTHNSIINQDVAFQVFFHSFHALWTLVAEVITDAQNKVAEACKFIQCFIMYESRGLHLILIWFVFTGLFPQSDNDMFITLPRCCSIKQATNPNIIISRYTNFWGGWIIANVFISTSQL